VNTVNLSYGYGDRVVVWAEGFVSALLKDWIVDKATGRDTA
jgi:hypothetical protein